MKQRKNNEWIWPPADQWLTIWGPWMTIMVAILSGRLLFYFLRLTGARWIAFYVIALAMASVGAALIFYAKLPLYRQRRFFTFGSRVLPEQRRPFYRWGYRCVAIAVVLLACLLLAKP
jgi:hypothetical protein